MKRFIYFLIFAVAIAAAGCSGRSTNEPTNTTKTAYEIRGHTYCMIDGANYIKLYFTRDYACLITIMLNGEYSSISNLTYTISDNNIDVYRDYSTYWQEAYRGKMIYHMIYQPADDTILFDGNFFSRYD